jgi:hypothetical protein
MPILEKTIKWNKRRLFGLELEFIPDNIDRQKLRKAVEEAGQKCQTRDWERSRDNLDFWVAKTDSSCGYELCSPPIKGPAKLKAVCDVVKSVFKAGATFNNRCGLHIHLGCVDFSQEQLYSLLAHWIKIEMVIMHAHPQNRLENPYCKTCNSKIANFDNDREYPGHLLFDILKIDRKQTLNLFYWEERKSIEFRMGEMSNDPDDIKNRIRFLIWFADICRMMPMPKNLNWFNPRQTMRFLGLCYDPSDTVKKRFSPGIIEMREWLLDRMERFTPEELYHKDKEIIKELRIEFKEQDKRITVTA